MRSGETGKLKHFVDHTDAYVTEDFARAIQEERKTLIKAMTEGEKRAWINKRKSHWKIFIYK